MYKSLSLKNSRLPASDTFLEDDWADSAIPGTICDAVLGRVVFGDDMVVSGVD